MSDEEEAPTLGIALQDPRTGGGIYDHAVDGTLFWCWYETIQKMGVDQAHRMAILTAEVIAGHLTEQEQARLRDVLESIKWRGGLSKDRRTQALSVSYDMLQKGEWTRSRAAELARWLLGNDVEPEAWRKAVNKWAKEQGKPELKLPHGRPTKKNRNIG